MRWSLPRARPTRKPAANRSPAPVTSTTCSIGIAGTASIAVAGHHHAAFLAARYDRELGVAAQRLDRGVEIGGLVKAVQFALVGEHDIDGALADQLEEFGAIAVDAERIRQRERDLARRLVRDRPPP